MQAGDDGLDMPDEFQDPQQSPFPILRKKLYDQNLSDWSARYRKNKQNLDSLVKECEVLRVEEQKSQREVDVRAERYRQLEDQCDHVINVKYQETKASYEAAIEQKAMLQSQISEHRKAKTQLTRERKMLKNDMERKQAELMRMVEVHDKLDDQLNHLSGQLGQLTSDRKRMERELDEVRHNLKTNTIVAEEVTNEITHFQGGIKESIPGMAAVDPDRMNTSQGNLSFPDDVSGGGIEDGG